MRYLLMIYTNQAAQEAVGRDMDAVMAEVATIMKELADSGEWVGGEGLAGPAESRTVTVRDGVPAVTDGPFLESKEFLAGYCVVECATRERAVEIAARWPDARYCAMEVRPLMGGDESRG
jgi:hypothetical protein